MIMPEANVYKMPEDLGRINAISYCCWNIRCYFKYRDEIVRLLLNAKLDILVLVETFLDDTHLDDTLNIDGYSFYRQDRTPESGKVCGGGILIYVRDTLCTVPNWTASKCNTSIETVWIKIKYPKNRPTYLCGIYRPPDGDIEMALQQLDEDISDVTDNVECELALLGDVNIDFLKPRSTV